MLFKKGEKGRHPEPKVFLKRGGSTIALKKSPEAVKKWPKTKGALKD